MFSIFYTILLVHLVCGCPKSESNTKQIDKGESFLSTSPQPAAVPNPTAEYAEVINSTCIRVNWYEAGSSQHPSVVYAVVTEPNYPQVLKTQAETIEIPNLQPSTEYTFHVYAISDTGDYILPGTETKAKTWDGVEENPSELEIVHLDFYGIRLEWKAVNYSERTKPLYTIMSNANDGQRIQTEKTTHDFTKLLPLKE